MLSVIGWVISAYIHWAPRHRGKPRIIRALSSLFKNAPIRSRYGVTMLSAPDSTTAMSLVGVYDDVYRGLDVLQSGMAFIDVGANAGVFSLVASKRVGAAGRVISFEPSPRIFQLFIKNAAINSVSNILPFQVAVGERCAVMAFNSGSPRHSGGAHLAESGPMKVLVMGGAELRNMLSLVVEDRQAVIKIDVEGAEASVLSSLKEFITCASVLRVIVEISASALARFGSKPQDIYRHMADCGFSPTVGPIDKPFYNEIFDRDALHSGTSVCQLQ